MRNGLTHTSTTLVDGSRQEGNASLNRPSLPPQPAPLSSPLTPITGHGRRPKPALPEAASSPSPAPGAGEGTRRAHLSREGAKRLLAERNYTSRQASPGAISRKARGAAPLHAGSCSPPLRAAITLGSPRSTPCRYSLLVRPSSYQTPTPPNPPRLPGHLRRPTASKFRSSRSGPPWGRREPRCRAGDTDGSVTTATGNSGWEGEREEPDWSGRWRLAAAGRVAAGRRGGAEVVVGGGGRRMARRYSGQDARWARFHRSCTPGRTLRAVYVHVLQYR